MRLWLIGMLCNLFDFRTERTVQRSDEDFGHSAPQCSCATVSPFGQAKASPGLRQLRRFDDLLARGGQPGQRQNRFRFARQRVQRRFLEPEVELATAAVAWERRGWRLAFRTVCRTGDLDMKMLGVTKPGMHLVKPSAISSGLAAQRLLDRGID